MPPQIQGAEQTAILIDGMGDLFFTSDLHLGHKNIIRLAGRPFNSTPEMNAWLLEAWNETVGEDATVFVLGDVVLGNRGDGLGVVSKMAGTKHLVVGNHDRCFGAPGQAAEQRDLAGGFASVIHGTTLVDVGLAAPALVGHFPYRGDHPGVPDRHAGVRPEDEGRWLLHGHLHGQYRRRGRMIDVGVDAWAGRPVPVGRILEVINGKDDEVPVVPWT